MTIRFLISALSEQDTVYIGGLGQFTKQHQAARIYDDKILPPSNIVTFDPNFKGDDLIFIQFVAQSGNILLSEASIEIEKWVIELNNALNNNKSISFEGFGTFAKDGNGVICFESEIIPALNLEFEGMGAIDNERSDVRSQKSEMGSEELNENENENSEELGVRSEELNDKQEPETNQVHSHRHSHSHSHSKKHKHKHKHRRHVSGKKVGIIIMIILLVLALAACAAYLFRYDVMGFVSKCKERLQNNTVEISDTTTTDTQICTFVDTTNSIDEDTLTIVEEEVEEEAEGQAIELVNTSKQVNTNSNNTIGQYETRYVDYESGKHYVIVGSFPSEKDVDRHIRDKQLKRFDPKIVKQAGVSNLRICIGIFDSEAEAENFGRNCGHGYWILN